MNIFFPEPDINIGEDGFGGKCGLGRAASGKKLSELVEKISEPVVIAVDGPWGSGKSHFLKLWTGAHRLENGGSAKVIYFDAFKHDYFDDPLVALVGQIFEDFSEEKAPDGKMKTFLKYAGRLVKPATRIALAAGTGFVSEAVGAVASATIQAVGKEGENALDPVWQNESNRRDAMEGFKQALKDLTIENGSEDKPQKIVIVVDELDRCRPDFALNMLETIKHFFAVENVIFVLGVNLAELKNSVKARYGAGINAGKYLQKFLHMRFELPPQIGEHTKKKSWLAYFEVMTTKLGISRNLTLSLKTYLSALPEGASISLRDIQRVLTVVALIPTSGDKAYSDNMIWGWREVVAGMVVLKCFHPNLYQKARQGTLTFKEMVSTFSILDNMLPIFNERIYSVWDVVFNSTRAFDRNNASTDPFFPHTFQEWELQNTIEELLETFEVIEPIESS